MDPLSEVLSLLKMRSHISAGFDAGGDWSVHFALQSDVIKCYAIEEGSCWMVVDGIIDPVRLEQGDCFVLPSGRSFRLTSDPDLRPVDSGHVFPAAHPGGVVRINDGGELLAVGSRFIVEGGHAKALLQMMPPIVRISREADQSALRWAVECMRAELREVRPGGALMADHLAHMMLLQALRLHLEEGSLGPGWFAALTDPRLGAAIQAMHAAPAQKWTLQALARIAGMSRSVFAERFRQTAGETPMDYLTRWRMMLACNALEVKRDPVAVVARTMGYESESAFSTAFKRIIGCTPSHYARDTATANG